MADPPAKWPVEVVDAARVALREQLRFSVIGVVTCLLALAAGTHATDWAWRVPLMVLLIVLGVLCVRTIRAWGVLRRAKRAVRHEPA